MPNLIAIANFIGTNQHITSPPLGGTNIVTEINTPGVGVGTVQMISENGMSPANSDLITEKII
tara:strand:- start:505 stop:693 length:189 start_codon:yes stop_codon:yes gene_type:complete